MEFILAHENSIRKIEECNTDDFSIQRFTIYDKFPLGNHYHNRKHETFKIVRGGGKVTVVRGEKIETLDIGPVPNTRLREDKTLLPGSVVHIAPGDAHRFILEPGSVMLCFSSEPFDENNKDMLPYEVLD